MGWPPAGVRRWSPRGEVALRQGRAWQTLEPILQHITPLNLLDPRAPKFRPEYCRTYHDITRFAHEKAMTELFQVSKGALSREGARLLKRELPLEIYVVDLGGGLSPEAAEQAEIRPEDLRPRPLRASWGGGGAH